MSVGEHRSGQRVQEAGAPWQRQPERTGRSQREQAGGGLRKTLIRTAQEAGAWYPREGLGESERHGFGHGASAVWRMGSLLSVLKEEPPSKER